MFHIIKLFIRHLIGSPFIIHKGKIGLIKLEMPSLSKLTKEYINIKIENISIELKYKRMVSPENIDIIKQLIQ